MSTKVKVLVEYEVDVPMTTKEANRLYPDTLWPREALALDRISEVGFTNLIKGSQANVKDVVIND